MLMTGAPQFFSPLPEGPEVVEIPGVRLWLEDLEDLYDLLAQCSQGVTIFRGNTVSATVADLQKARRSDLQRVQFETVGPNIVINFENGSIYYPAGVAPCLKNRVKDIFDTARRVWYIPSLDVIGTTLFILGMALGALFLPAPEYTISLVGYAVYELSQHVSWVPRPTREFLFWTYLLCAGVFVSESIDNSKRAVKVIPYSRSDIRQVVMHAHVGWVTNLMGAIVLLILTVPVAILVAWLSDYYGF